MTTEERIISVLLEDFELFPESKFSEVGMDSLDYLHAIVQIEEEFALKFPPEVEATFETPRQIAKWIDAQ